MNQVMLKTLKAEQGAIYRFIRDAASDNGTACFRDGDHLAERAGTSRRQATVHLRNLEREHALVRGENHLGMACYVPLDPDPRRRSMLLKAIEGSDVQAHLAGRIVFLHGRGLTVTEISSRTAHPASLIEQIIAKVRSVGYLL